MPSTLFVRRFLLALVVPLLFAAIQIHAAERKLFAESIRPIDETSAPREAIADAELDAPMGFMFSLKMRDFDGLQTRIAKGEILSQAEMSEKYYPLESDFHALKSWAIGQGFTPVRDSSGRLCLFVSAPVRRVQSVLQVQFSKVAAGGKTVLSASTPPSLPAEISGCVLGSHGLQPHIQRRNHMVRKTGAVAGRSGNAPPYEPREILKAYGAAGIQANGSGQKIAIVIDTFPDRHDLTQFWNSTGVGQSQSNVEFVQVVDGVLAPPSGEETLDVEWSGGIASGAKIKVYASKDLSDMNLSMCYSAIIDDLPTEPTLHQVSLSFGLAELATPVGQMQSDSQLFATLSAAGVTVFCSSGDEGSVTNGSGAAHKGTLQIESPGNDPHITVVGGTTLNLNTGTGAIDTESAWFGTGGGIGVVFNRPSWQAGASLPPGTTRVTPDVASAADPDTGCLVVQDGQPQQVGGTSWSAPTWAGICAIINQARANAGLPPTAYRGSLLGPKIYPLLGTSSFHDITTGNNGTKGLYNAGPGFDLCTGLGTPNLSALVAALAQPTPLQFTSDPNAAPANAATGQAVTFSGAASSSAAVTITWDFGDGTPAGSGTSVTHAYSTAGIYTAAATASDGVNFVTQFVTVTVSDQFTVAKSALKFDFVRQNDAYSFTGNIHVPPKFLLSQTVVEVDIGGYSQMVTLSSAGSGKDVGIQVKLSGKASKGLLTTTTAALTVSLSKQNLFNSFQQFGFTNNTVTAAGPFQITATVKVNGAAYTAMPNYTYTAKAGSSGKGTLQP